MFLFTREVWNTRAALFSACFIAIVPGKGKRQGEGERETETERGRERGGDIYMYITSFQVTYQGLLLVAMTTKGLLYLH